jgi:TolA-binding protein
MPLFVLAFAGTTMGASSPVHPSDAGMETAEREHAAFEAALELGTRDPAAAIQALEQLAAADPAGDDAADALHEAAQLAEQRLAEPDRALALYQRLLERYPNHRLALRARARRDFLAAGLRSGVSPLAEYQDILQGYATRPRATSVARMERLIAAHPGFALAARALLWLGENALQAGEHDTAERHYRDVQERWPGTAVAREAALGQATTSLAAGRPLKARRLYQTLLSTPESAVRAAASRGLTTAEHQLARQIGFFVALFYFFGYLGAQLWIARGGLWPLPLEFKFYLPVAVLFVLASLSARDSVLPALALIAGGGALVTWFAGAASRRALRQGASRTTALRSAVLRLIATVLAVLGLVYAALHATNLVDFLIETLRYGPER